MYRFAFIAALALTGCTDTTGMTAAGSRMDPLTGHAAPSLAENWTARRTALDEATAYCQAEGRQMMLLDLKISGSGVDGPTTFTTTFLCLLPTDPELQR